MEWYARSLSVRMATFKVALPGSVSRPRASKDSDAVSGVNDAFRLVALDKWKPGHGVVRPEDESVF